MTGVPAAGLPKTTSVVARRSSPTGLRLGPLVDHGEDLEALRRQELHEPATRVRDRARALLGDDAPRRRPRSSQSTDRIPCGLGGHPRRARGVVVTEPFGRLEIPQRHPDPDRQLRLGVVPALGAIDDPSAIRPLADLWIVGLQLRLLAFPPRCRGTTLRRGRFFGWSTSSWGSTRLATVASGGAPAALPGLPTWAASAWATTRRPGWPRSTAPTRPPSRSRTSTPTGAPRSPSISGTWRTRW